jgi:hypothetical protein
MVIARSIKPKRSLAALSLCLGLANCSPADGPEPAVEYSASSTLQPYIAPPMLPGVGAAGGAAASPAVGAGGVSGLAPMPTGVGGSDAATMPMMGTAGKGPISTGAGGMGMILGAAGSAGGTAGSGGPTPTSTLTKLTFSFTTKAYGGKYTPKNVGAVYVEDASGKWIHTLEYWGSTPNDTHLPAYIAAKAPDYALCAGLDALLGNCTGMYVTMPPADVVTGATINPHRAHTGDSWDLKDASGKVIADGSYNIVVEMAEDELSEKTQKMPFTKGAMPVNDMPADTATVTGMKLTLQ